MHNKKQKTIALKLKPVLQSTGCFELKLASNISLGFILNGNVGGQTLVIAGTGASTQIVFEQMLLWPESKNLLGRLALILLDKIDSIDSTMALQEITSLLKPVRDTLFLPAVENPEIGGNVNTLNTIENFCKVNDFLSEEEAIIDCASI